MIDYSLAPRHRYPQAHNEVSAVVAWISAHHASPWFLVGDSAGGGLAVGVAYRLRDHRDDLPRGIILTSPWLDLTMSSVSISRAAASGACAAWLGHLARAADAYAGPGGLREPYASPSHGDPRGLPPVLLHAGAQELFVAENRDWVERCRRQEVPCTFCVIDGGFHSFAIAPPWLPEAKAALRDQAAFIERRLASAAPSST